MPIVGWLHRLPSVFFVCACPAETARSSGVGAAPVSRDAALPEVTYAGSLSTLVPIGMDPDSGVGGNYLVHALVGIGTKKKDTSRSETNSLTAEVRQKYLASGWQMA